MKTALVLALIAVVASVEPALSCRKDGDCGLGRKCISAPASSSGVCVEGELKGVLEGDDEAQTAEEKPLRQAVKNPCQYDDQCERWEQCFRTKGDSYGVCIRK